MPELCCRHCDCCIAAWDGDHCRQCGADCYDCPLRTEMLETQRIRREVLPFWIRLLLAVIAAGALYALAWWLL
jgi:hypothetical protein